MEGFQKEISGELIVHSATGVLWFSDRNSLRKTKSTRICSVKITQRLLESVNFEAIC